MSRIISITEPICKIHHLPSTEQMQQAVVWPNYSNHNNGNALPPPLLLPPPPPSLQLLSDIGGARLVLTESKRKQQSTLPIVKIEADCGTTPTTIISKYHEVFSFFKSADSFGKVLEDCTWIYHLFRVLTVINNNSPKKSILLLNFLLDRSIHPYFMDIESLLTCSTDQFNFAQFLNVYLFPDSFYSFE